MLKETSNAHVPAVSPLLKAYLVAYNIFSALGWAYVLGLTLTHLFDLDGNADAVQTYSKGATSVLSRFMSKVLGSTPSTVESRLPPFLQPIYHRSASTYVRVGIQTAIVQTFAVLEVVHVLLGWVRSPLQTTVMQVSSRLFLVWGIADQFPEVSSSLLDAACVSHSSNSVGALESPLHQHGSGVVCDRNHPLFVLCMQPSRKKPLCAFTSPIYHILRSLSFGRVVRGVPHIRHSPGLVACVRSAIHRHVEAHGLC